MSRIWPPSQILLGLTDSQQVSEEKFLPFNPHVAANNRISVCSFHLIDREARPVDTKRLLRPACSKVRTLMAPVS